jgi:AcrR family transcriptional regulator
MSIEDRRQRERDARRRLIIGTARRLAEAEGWDAVTTRRLATEIEYSQPVLYKHFSGMDQIAAAVAIDGFGELGDALGAARAAAESPHRALVAVAHAYLVFARENPALYDAMFARTTTVHFAAEDTPAQLSEAFAELREGLRGISDDGDVDTLAEVFWAALHGLTILARGGRLRPDHDAERVERLAAQFSSVTTVSRGEGTAYPRPVPQ